MAYIYMTTNLVNGKRYIGQSSLSPRKFKWYFGSGRVFSRALSKYGTKAFKKEILIEGDFSREMLDELERHYIRLYAADIRKDFYNIDAGGWRGKGATLKYKTKRYGLKRIFRFNKSQELIEEYYDTYDGIARSVGLAVGGTVRVLADNETFSRVLNGYLSRNAKLGNVKMHNKEKMEIVHLYSSIGEYICTYKSTWRASLDLGLRNSAVTRAAKAGYILDRKYYILPEGSKKSINVVKAVQAITKEELLFQNAHQAQLFLMHKQECADTNHHTFDKYINTSTPFRGYFISKEIRHLCHLQEEQL